MVCTQAFVSSTRQTMLRHCLDWLGLAVTAELLITQLKPGCSPYHRSTMPSTVACLPAALLSTVSQRLSPPLSLPLSCRDKTGMHLTPSHSAGHWQPLLLTSCWQGRSAVVEACTGGPQLAVHLARWRAKDEAADGIPAQRSGQHPWLHAGPVGVGTCAAQARTEDGGKHICHASRPCAQ